jgi:transposase
MTKKKKTKIAAYGDLSAQGVEQVIAEYKKGTYVRDIMKKYGIGTGCVYDILYAFDVPMRGGKPVGRQMLEERQSKIETMRTVSTQAFPMRVICSVEEAMAKKHDLSPAEYQTWFNQKRIDASLTYTTPEIQEAISDTLVTEKVPTFEQANERVMTEHAETFEALAEDDGFVKSSYDATPLMKSRFTMVHDRRAWYKDYLDGMREDVLKAKYGYGFGTLYEYMKEYDLPKRKQFRAQQKLEQEKNMPAMTADELVTHRRTEKAREISSIYSESVAELPENFAAVPKRILFSTPEEIVTLFIFLSLLTIALAFIIFYHH